MELHELVSFAQNVGEARDTILDRIRQGRDRKIIYYHGWDGFGAAPVLRSIAQELRSIRAKRTPSELCFDRIIYIDCSAWESRRQMQRKIADELQLDLGTMAMFDKKDEEDDFNGLDHGSRDVILSVSQVILRTLISAKFMMIFLNGSDDEIDLNIYFLVVHKLRYTHLYVIEHIAISKSSNFVALLCEEAANKVALNPHMQGIDLTVVTECCLYELFLHHSFHRATGFDWAAQAPNYWMCDGIIEGDGRKGISDTLHQEIHWEIDSLQVGIMFEKLMKDPEFPFLIAKGDTPLSIKKSYRWISVTSGSKNPVILNEDTYKAILERVSSLFVAPEESDDLHCLPDGFLKHCSNLGVLILSRCAFSFVSPPFLGCHGLRFLGLDHCINDNTSEAENNTSWTFLGNLWVLDLRYTEWDDILSEDRMHNMDNLMELNIEGFMCWQLASRVHGKLPCLRRLRIIKPMQKADTSTDSSNNLFVDKTELEVLDLSGNRDMKNLSISSAMARSLQILILDDCDGLENVVVPDGLPSSLRSFSFDGYGPADHWTSSFKLPPKRSEQKHSSDADISAVKTSKISLQGCTQLDNFFVRGLSNLEELDLSGSKIKVLDFKTMVINVPALKRLLLLGWQHLCAIKWGSFDSVSQLQLLCVDTRPWSAHGSSGPCHAKDESSGFQLHATLADARLSRSLFALFALFRDHGYERAYKYHYIPAFYSFNIHVTSSSGSGGGVQFGTIGEEMIEPSSQQHEAQVTMYSDAFAKIGVAPMLLFPRPPTQPLDRHIEISDGSRGLDSELGRFRDDGLAKLLRSYTSSLHVHDTPTSAGMAPGGLEWCRIERCPNLGTVFPEEHWPEQYWGGENKLQTIWASHLLMARCIWSKGFRSSSSFESLQHLHLRSCPRLQCVLPVWVASFPSLETLHIIHCGDLTHVFVLDNEHPDEIVVRGLPLPKLTTIHLHDLPKLQQICEVKKMLAPALQTVRIRGCFGLRRLPALAGREPGVKKPTVEMEKDVWGSLEWDGLAAGHHPDLFAPPVHSRYYRRSRLLRGTVLR